MSRGADRARFPQGLRDGRLRMCQRQVVRPGERVAVVGSASEAAMHAGVTDRIVEVVLTPTRSPRLYEAHLYEPGEPHPFVNWMTHPEAGIYQDSSSGELWAYSPVPAEVEAGWAPLAGRGGGLLETDRWDEACGWLANELNRHAADARWWADHGDGCTGQPPCADCKVACWRRAAPALTSLAEALREPPSEPAWSQAAGDGWRCWITTQGEPS